MNSILVTALGAGLLLLAALGVAEKWTPPPADFPKAEISNGVLRAMLYLPDAHKGYYRGTRFDWSGVVAALEYKGKNYYGPWYNRIDPKVNDFTYEGAEIVASPCSGIPGPVEEFVTNQSALGFDEAKVGETFIKIGVGVLRKDDAAYDYVKLYEIVDPGKWAVKTNRDSAEFSQELADPATGYGYLYRKTVRLVPGKPQMVLEHTLKNTGRRTIRTSVYNHNFLVLEHQAPGPDFSISVPFQIQSSQPPDPRLARIRGNQIVYSKALEDKEVVEIPIRGFGESSRDHEIRIENRRVGAGMIIRGDRPLSFMNLWSIRSVLAIEPFIAMTIEPGSEFTWQVSYEYFTLGTNPR